MAENAQVVLTTTCNASTKAGVREGIEKEQLEAVIFPGKSKLEPEPPEPEKWTPFMMVDIVVRRVHSTIRTIEVA